MIVYTKQWITREYMDAHPTWLFLFGDNLLGHGWGGQAREMRGAPNALGIPTKKRPDRRGGSYFTDDEYEKNCAAIDRAFERIYQEGWMVVVLPEHGIGTGLADLPYQAPRTYEHLLEKIRELGPIDRLDGRP